ncbi:MAG: hypothetical protein Q9160_001880 [Pyrenula sp. 1 TL-2023]
MSSFSKALYLKLRCAILQSGATQRRSILTWIRSNAAIAQKESPILYPTLLVATVLSLAALIAFATNEYLIVAPKYAAYPREVEHHLRQGIYYSEIKFDPEKSFESFAEALRVAEALGMDRFSDEILGIHIRITAMLEKAGKAKAAIEILERTSTDCLSWVSDHEQEGESPSQTERVHLVQVNEDQQPMERDSERRARLFHKAVECRVKAAELYDSDYIQDAKTARELLSNTFSLILKEAQKIGADVPRNMTKSEVAAIADQLAHMQLAIGLPQLAVPLYLYALNNLRQDEGRPTCKQVMLISNISSMLPSVPAANEATEERRIEDAKNWAEKALEVAASINPTERDHTCDSSCAVATFTLAEIARMSGDKVAAKPRYKEAMTFAKTPGVDDGNIMRNASRGQLAKMDLPEKGSNTA